MVSYNYEMLWYDSRLFSIYKVVTLPATGVQLFYEKPIREIAHQLIGGTMITHPWGITVVDQTGYWQQPEKYAGSYGVISIYLSVTNQIGKYIKKTMQKCTLNEIAYEMFTELENVLAERNISIPKRVGFFAQHYSHEQPQLEETDPIVRYHFNGSTQDQLHLCITGMRKWRPKPETLYLGNLILCGAYTQTHTYHVSTMEGACESGRRAANTIFKSLKLTPIEIYESQVPRHVRWLRSFDRVLYALFLPNPLVLIMKCLRSCLRNKNIHMHPDVRSYETLHW